MSSHLPLHAAILQGDLDLLDRLLGEGVDVQAEDQGGRTALHVAAAEGYLDACRSLLQRDTSLLARCTKAGNTPLHRAAAYGHAPIVSLLHSANSSSLNALNKEGATPLSRAARWGHGEAVKVLVRCGASLTIPDAALKTPLVWATTKGFPWVLEALGTPSNSASSSSSSKPAYAKPSSPNTQGGGSGASPILPLDVPQPGVVLTVEGWMAKEGHFFKNWKNRWFLLEGRRLLYFSKPSARKPQGIILLDKGSDVFVEERYSRPFCFTLLTLSKKFILQAANEEEMAEWIEVRWGLLLSRVHRLGRSRAFIPPPFPAPNHHPNPPP